MIKINLLRNVGAAPGNVGLPRAGDSVTTEAVVKQLAVAKGMLLLVPMFILFGIEKYNISILTKKLAETNQEVAKVDEQIKSYGDTGPLLEKYSAIKSKLEKQFDSLQGIGARRLREVKTLDSLQTIIPARNWINQVAIDEVGRVSLSGYSETPDGAFSFVRAIEENPNFSEVSKVSVSTDSNGSNGRAEGLKKYSFEFRIGKSK